MSLSAATFGLPTYPESPVHCLIVSGLILIFRKQILSLLKAACGLCILIVFATLRRYCTKEQITISKEQFVERMIRLEKERLMDNFEDVKI